MQHDIYIYLLLMSAVTLAIRIVPLTLIRGQIKNGFLRSFLFYVPYVTLAVMTFPAITEATQTPVSGAGPRLRHRPGLVRREPFQGRLGPLLRRRSQ
mgnify:CR=1 FL=1